jgi:acyl-CoA thioesterase FadM
VDAPYQTVLRTRGYECDRTRTVPIPVFMSYLEHLRWEVIRRPELGLEPLLDQGCFFVVGRQAVELLVRVGLGVELRLTTRIEKVGRATAEVTHAVHRVVDDVLVAHARVMGMWLGPDRRLARLPDSLREVWRQHDALPRPALSPPTPAAGASAYTPSIVSPPEVVHTMCGLDGLAPPPDGPPEGAWAYQMTVRPSDIDIFDHVNAASYLRFCDDARLAAADAGALGPAEGQRARGPAVRVAIAYHREAVRGDALTIATWPAPGDRPGFLCDVRRSAEPALPLVTCHVEVA